MEIRNLTTFIHVAELGSFTKTAERLGYSQSTVSFQIKQLEDELSCLLFERINHTVKLTEKGRELVPVAQKICSLTEELKDTLSETNEHGHLIHIVTPDSVCEDMIITNYNDFHSKYPDISLKFTNADTKDMFDMLDKNEADLVITLDSHSYNRDYVIAKEERLKMHFVANASSKFAHQKNLSIFDIIDEPFILTERGQGYRKVLDRELAKKSIEIFPILEIGRTDIITSILSQKNMISFLPDFVSQEMVDEGKLVHLDVYDIETEIWKQLIYHKNKWLSKSMRALIGYIKNAEFKS
ncbi:MAG: LysR family transcriptional regulator [Ruminococcaceae bacterium]|nr:LysR family transcriptional regulator [Oscillospiraceae bacterium]